MPYNLLTRCSKCGGTEFFTNGLNQHECCNCRACFEFREEGVCRRCVYVCYKRFREDLSYPEELSGPVIFADVNSAAEWLKKELYNIKSLALWLSSRAPKAVAGIVKASPNDIEKGLGVFFVSKDNFVADFSGVGEKSSTLTILQMGVK